MTLGGTSKPPPLFPPFHQQILLSPFQCPRLFREFTLLKWPFPPKSPTLGTLLALSPEEVVIKPAELDGEGEGSVLGAGGPVDVRVHFPRLGFVVRPTATRRGGRVRGGGAKL